MPAKIQKLALASFRGATQKVEVSFDTGKPVALIFGENGTGKSTIADALDFICNRQFGSLDDRSMSGKPKSHVTSLGHDTKLLRVNVTTTGGSFSAALAKDGPVVSPAVGCPDARILRRSNILQLLDAQPKDRFEALKAFIAVPGIEASENALRQAEKDAGKDYTTAVDLFTHAQGELEKLWLAEGKPGKNSSEWAAGEVKKDITALKNAVAEVGKLLPLYQAAESHLIALDRAAGEVTTASSAHSRAQEEQTKAEAKQAKGNASLLKLLQDAKSYIDTRKPMGECPVCEQGIDADGLISRLEHRVGEMAELAAASSAVAVAKNTLKSKQSVASQARTDFCSSARKLANALKDSTLQEVVNLHLDWAVFADLLAHTDAIEATEKSARDFWNLVLPIRVQLTARKVTDQKSVDQKNAIQGYHDTVVDKLKAAGELAGLVKKLKAALEIVMKQRKAYVEGVLDAISGEVEKLYSKLHPNEAIGKVRFYLKPNTIGSLEFDAQFQTESELPPQAYYSESHLDTLGICVFLALAKHFKTEHTVVVLDDVVTSVDGPHLDRFMDLLHAEAPNFNQVIVTTHYRPWKDRYRYARGPAAKTQVIELRSWSLTTGVQTDEAQTLVQELKNGLAAGKFNRQAVASNAGIQLENVLDFLTYQFRCKLPRQTDPNYTLGDLAAGVDSKLGKFLKVMKSVPAGGAKAEALLKPLIDDATALTWVRNRAGCHFHSLGSEISDGEIKDFGSKVVALSDTIICQKCHCFPTRRPSGSCWQCECGEVEMHPLIAPGAALGTVATEE